jgi:hypothetical protein
MGLHVFVAMPYGRKHDIDFDAVFADCLRPALESAGYQVFRVDEQRPRREIDAGIIQALLETDLVVVDQTLDTPDVWYELDVLNALSAHGVLPVQSDHAAEHPVRKNGPKHGPKLIYHLRNGRPDPDRLEADRQAIAEMARTDSEPRSERMRRSSAGAGSGREEPPRQPRRVFLFSGHMIDAPGRIRPRFPASRENIAAAAIAGMLDELGVDENDLAICGGACGGDLLFAEAALQRGCRVELYLQFKEAAFLDASVTFAGRIWMDRYYAVRAHHRTQVHIQPDELGPLPEKVNPYERNNLWQLFTALAHGADRVHFIGLWDGGGGAGPGGTQHMVETVRKHAGQVSILDTRLLFGL